MPAIKWLLVITIGFTFFSINAFALDIRHNGNFISLSGEIIPNDFNDFYKATSNKKIVPIYLNSGGGHVEEAIKIGTLIRAKGYETRLAQNATCASACVLIFAGGIIRSADQSSKIGLHMTSSIYNDATTKNVTDLIEAEGKNAVPYIVSFFEASSAKITMRQVAYLLKMGVSLRLLEHSISVHHTDIDWLTKTQSKDFNIINN